MELDDELCLCFHVTRRKVENWIRVERPKRAGQLSDCYGAGTGCGWCRPFLRKLFEESAAKKGASSSQEVPSIPDTAAVAPPVASSLPDTTIPDAAAYSKLRARYIRDGGGVPPPGAEPPPELEEEK